MIKRILHIANDEKFIDFVINSFNNNNQSKNEYFIFSNSDNLTYIKNVDEVKLVHQNIKLFEENVILADLILLHKMSEETLIFLEKLNNNKKIIWFPWGVDFYEKHEKLKSKILLNKTKKLFQRNNKKKIKNEIRKILSFLNIKKEFYQRQESILHKIQYIAPVIKEDYDIILKTYNNSSHIKYLPFIYGNVNTLINKDFSVKGDNILLGNSASYSNNHIEAIDLLSKVKLKGKIQTVLSYGNNVYAKQINNYGHEKLKDSFSSLLEFITLDEYLNILSKCEFVIMNHTRQQAMGNIYAMLYGGAKVFLRNENPIYSFLKRNNIIVFDLSMLQSGTAFIPLSKKEKEKNKKNIEQILCPENTINFVGNIINCAE